METQYYCPDCKSKLEIVAGCGSVSYFCNKCNLIISKKRILSDQQVKESKA